MNASKGTIRFALLILVLLPVACLQASRPQHPLEAYEFQDVILIETVEVDGSRLGCFLLPDGKVVLGAPGDTIGPRGATLVAITEHYVDVVELVSVNRGEWAEAKFSWPVSEKRPAGIGCIP